MSRRQGFPSVLLLSVVAFVGCASSNSRVAEVQKLQAREAYDRALSHINDKQPAPAVQALMQAINVNPSSAPYRDTLGLVLLDLGQTDQALERFKQAIEIDPLFADAHFHMGTALAETRRWEEAVKSYRRALELPTLTIPELTNHNLGVALYNLKRYAEAEQTLRFAIKLDPKMQGAYYNLGLVFEAENRREEAKAAFRQARQLGPDSPFGQAAQDRLRALGEGG